MKSSEYIDQLKEKGISLQTFDSQISCFKEGFPQLDVMRAATLGDGIRKISNSETEGYGQILTKAIAKGHTVSKFVPASGAASRMFKDLYQYLEKPVALKNLDFGHPIVRFIELLPRFAFFHVLQENLRSINLNNVHVRKSKATEIIRTLLNEDGLNYGNLPKGLILFHSYVTSPHTAMEEHLTEGASYAVNNDGMVKVHFTVSPEHHELFKEKLHQKGPAIENKFETGLDVTFSFQKPHTDTVAVTPENEPFIDENGQLLFRPGGHGALIENLNDTDSEIVFIKNIDNVVPEELAGTTILYKKALAGLLLELQSNVHKLLKRLDEDANDTLVNEICSFIKQELFAATPDSFSTLKTEEKIKYLQKYLNRPIRVCGMVRNEGEPGGGPFWVKEKSGQETLQILESSQLNMNDPAQVNLLKSATHFNPVDLVCATKDYLGHKFDLTKFTDPNTGFITEKSYNGQPLKAMELPGLWNGAMADWITLFVEVPIETFNPVKTVNDLLRPQHQPVTT
jgi:hypothetical protein